MDKWEYRIEAIINPFPFNNKSIAGNSIEIAQETIEWMKWLNLQEANMNEIGEDGWELVSVFDWNGDDFKCIYKRKKRMNKKEKKIK